MRYDYRHLDWREVANRLAADQAMLDLFRSLMEAFDGDAERALQEMERQAGRLRRQAGFDPGEFERTLREHRLIEGQKGERRLSRAGERDLREDAFRRVFGGMAPGARGSHASRRPGRDGEWTGATRPWLPGDGAEDLAYRESLLSAMREGRRALDESDLQVRERESRTGCAWTLMLDVSHSMTLYGEDRITPAKRVALALAEHLGRNHPRDDLDILLFGDDVRPVTVQELPYISNGPFHTNTCEALRRSAEILTRRRQPNRRAVMITDGKPTALFTGSRRELTINSGYGLDPQIVAATLRQAARYPRLGIRLSVFMVADDPYLQRFVERLVAVARGEAYRATLEDLGKQVLGRLFA
jgi:Ca-activated chloride channel family protein